MGCTLSPAVPLLGPDAPGQAQLEVLQMPKRVDLDAMIPRADFDVVEEPVRSTDLIKDFPIAYLGPNSPYLKLLRKPDFQRETNHWSPEQVVSLISSFVDDEVIPSLIIWRAPRYIFVIDGGHRLSALRAWMEDDYGDQATSLAFYGGDISKRQREIAKVTRKMIERQVGTYAQLQGKLNLKDAPQRDQNRAQVMLTRALTLQWIQGSSKVAEASFFKINSQGTPLDETEGMLIKNREKPLAISARAILRAGSGHKYWSDFHPDVQNEIEGLATEFHERFFKPEASEPLKTLDLPIGGTVSPVDALALLVEFLSFAGNRDKDPRGIALYDDDLDGSKTVRVMKNGFHVLNRIAGNAPASLGLHPAVYFYNDRGKYSRFLFLGMAWLIQDAVRNNNSRFFIEFTRWRSHIEAFLIANKSLIGLAVQNMAKGQRVKNIKLMYELLLTDLKEGKTPVLELVMSRMGLQGRILDVKASTTTSAITDDTKSMIYVRQAIERSLRCPICDGLLDPSKSVSYDHVVPVRHGGKGTPENTQMAHPFCNTGYKEHLASLEAKEKV
jgi:hypothetical protein